MSVNAGELFKHNIDGKLRPITSKVLEDIRICVRLTKMKLDYKQSKDGGLMHVVKRFEHSYGAGGPFAGHAFPLTAPTAYPAVVRIQLLGPSHRCRVDEQQRNVGHQCTYKYW
ncbi:hypothetical protein GQX74_013114 [Glossina fuscipes]|nr:hypothetical protein GQX74_013114 [Glossina fuscipes]